MDQIIGGPEMTEKKQSPTVRSVDASRQDLKGVATNDQRGEFRTMAKLNEQTQDLKKSINVFNTNTGVKNPFLQNNNAQPQSQPSPATNNTSANNNTGTQK